MPPAVVAAGHSWADVAFLVAFVLLPAVIAWHDAKEKRRLARQDLELQRLHRRLDALELMTRRSIGGPRAGGTRDAWRYRTGRDPRRFTRYPVAIHGSRRLPPAP